MNLFESFFKNRFISAIFLALISFFIYLSTLSYGFLHFDDHLYVTQNPYVMSGVTLEGLKWAFFSYGVDNWIPLTWMSHMLDVQFFGLNAGAHHAVNVLLHGLNAALLFWVLDGMTRRRKMSWLVAFLFAIHPSHIESVAWIAERKDVLSAFFALISIEMYRQFAQKSDKNILLRFSLSLFFFALSLLSKPMYVTLPLLLFVFDFWPLERLRSQNEIKSALLNKVPFMIMAALTAWLTIQAHQHSGAVFTASEMPFKIRISFAVLSLGGYFQNFFWPQNLSVFYPPFSEMVIKTYTLPWIFLLSAVTFFACISMRRKPWFFSGWMIFIITLFPVLGLIKTGDQAMADRYTYFSYTGLLILFIWGFETIIRKNLKIKIGIFFLLAVWIGFILSMTLKRIPEWKSTESLFQAAAKVHPHNHVAWKVLADDAYSRGDFSAAAQYLSKALEVLPSEYELARPGYEINLAVVSFQAGNYEKAAELYEKNLQSMPLKSDLWVGLGDAQMQMSLPAQARVAYEHALQVSPGNREIQERLQKAKAALGI